MGQIFTHIAIKSKFIQRRGNEYFRVAVADMQGRRGTQEDRHNVVLRIGSKSHPDAALFGVYDGHAGTAAAQFLHDEFPARVGAMKNPQDPNAMAAMIMDVDVAYQNCESERHCRMGSTSIFSIVYPGEVKDGKRQYKVQVNHVGDSRAILLKANGDFIIMSQDHDAKDPKERERIHAAGGFEINNRVDGQLAMSRSIGDCQYKRLKSKHAVDQKVIALCDVTMEDAEEGDTLIICCDGLFEKMSTEELTLFIHQTMRKMKKDVHKAEVLAGGSKSTVPWGRKFGHNASAKGPKDYPKDDNTPPPADDDEITPATGSGATSTKDVQVATYAMSLYEDLSPHIPSQPTITSGAPRITIPDERPAYTDFEDEPCPALKSGNEAECTCRVDLGELITQLLDTSLERGSCDNMTAMVCCLEDGRSYHEPGKDEFIPGPITEVDDALIEAYMDDCFKHGMGIKEALKQIKSRWGEKGLLPEAEEMLLARQAELLKRRAYDSNATGDNQGEMTKKAKQQAKTKCSPA